MEGSSYKASVNALINSRELLETISRTILINMEAHGLKVYPVIISWSSRDWKSCMRSKYIRRVVSPTNILLLSNSAPLWMMWIYKYFQLVAGWLPLSIMKGLNSNLGNLYRKVVRKVKRKRLYLTDEVFAQEAMNMNVLESKGIVWPVL